MNLKEFAIFIGFDLDEAALNNVETKIDKVKDTFVKLGTVVLAASAALGLVVHSTSEESVELSKLAAIMGVSVEKAGEWAYAAQKAGVDVDDLTQLAAELGENIGEAAGGTGEAAQAFQSLGIKLKDAKGNLRETPEVLFEIADKMHKLADGTKKTGALTGLFGEEGIKLVGILNSGSGAIREMMAEGQSLGVVMRDDAAKAGVEVSKQMATMQSILKAITMTIGAEVLPTVNELLKAFIEWWKANKELIKIRIDKLFRVLTPLIKAVVWVLSALGKVLLWVYDNWVLIAAIVGAVILVQLAALWQWLVMLGFAYAYAAARAVAAAVRTAAAWLAANGVMLLWVAAVALLILILDDIYGWWTGKDSVIGRIIDGLRAKWNQFIAAMTADNPNDPWWLKAIKGAVRDTKALIANIEALLNKSRTLTELAGAVVNGGASGSLGAAARSAMANEQRRRADAEATANYVEPSAEQKAAFSNMIGGLIAFSKGGSVNGSAPSIFPSTTNSSKSVVNNNSMKNEIKVEGVSGEEVADKIAEKLTSTWSEITGAF